MKITIMQRQSDGSNKCVVFSGKVIEEEGMDHGFGKVPVESFLLGAETALNEGGRARIHIEES